MKKFILCIMLILFLIVGFLAWRHSGYIPNMLLNEARGFMFKDRINQMFEENKNLINRVSSICESTDDENVVRQQVSSVLFDYQKLLDKYTFLTSQILPASDKAWGDWSINDQWIELVYKLILVDNRTKDPKRKIKDAAANVIIESKLFDQNVLNQYISSRLAYDRIKVGEI
jgi:hypothetical protein